MWTMVLHGHESCGYPFGGAVPYQWIPLALFFLFISKSVWKFSFAPQNHIIPFVFLAIPFWSSSLLSFSFLPPHKRKDVENLVLLCPPLYLTLSNMSFWSKKIGWFIRFFFDLSFRFKFVSIPIFEFLCIYCYLLTLDKY